MIGRMLVIDERTSSRPKTRSRRTRVFHGICSVDNETVHLRRTLDMLHLGIFFMLLVQIFFMSNCTNTMKLR
jgi:hypothetical protein